ncbi:hypothetical protein FBU31_005990, partial [Coemansia sp. 'formosensis']
MRKTTTIPEDIAFELMLDNLPLETQCFSDIQNKADSKKDIVSRIIQLADLLSMRVKAPEPLPTHPPPAPQPAPTSFDHRGREGTTMGHRSCNNCGSLNYFVRNCSTCVFCHKYGHNILHCTHPKARRSLVPMSLRRNLGDTQNSHAKRNNTNGRYCPYVTLEGRLKE